jgi:ferredoxin
MAAKIPIIDAARCSGCGRCIAACHLGLFAFERQGWRKISVLQDQDRCTGCAKCDAMCPVSAIAMEKKVGHAVTVALVNPVVLSF